jgi:hypothetical protein
MQTVGSARQGLTASDFRLAWAGPSIASTGTSRRHQEESPRGGIWALAGPCSVFPSAYIARPNDQRRLSGHGSSTSTNHLVSIGSNSAPLMLPSSMRCAKVVTPVGEVECAFISRSRCSAALGPLRTRIGVVLGRVQFTALAITLVAIRGQLRVARERPRRRARR